MYDLQSVHILHEIDVDHKEEVVAVNISKMGFKGYLLLGGVPLSRPLRGAPEPPSIMNSPCPGIRSKRRVVASTNSNPPLQNP